METKDNNYLYNYKELNADHDLKWYDYGARFYDAVIGRWHVVDPMGETTPNWNPYNYVQNEPINAIDPDGRACVGCGPNGENMLPPKSDGHPMYIGASSASAWPPENGTAGQTHVDSDGSFVHDGKNWMNKEDGSYLLPTITITASSSNPSSDNTGMGLALFGAGMEGASFEMYNKNTWFSLYKMKSYYQSFNGNGYTGGKNAHGRYWSNGLDFAGKLLGAYQAYDILNQRMYGEINNVQFVGEQASNAYSTFGGLPGAAWGIGWEAGRVISKTDWYHQNIYLPINPGGRDGLISTKQ